MKFLAIMLVFAVIFSGLAGISQAQDDELILRVAMQDDMKTTNPLVAGDVWTWNVIGYLYDGPINVNPDTDEIIPYIAVGTADDPGDTVEWADCQIGRFDYTQNSTWNSTIGEAIVFYDFEDVYWHDGEQMDIRDVMFSMHVTAQVPEWSSSMNCLKDMAGKTGTNYSVTSWLNIYKVWESPNKLQAALKYVMTEPYADFFRGTLSTFLLPEHIWAYEVSGQNVDAAKIWCDPGYNPELDNAWQVDLALAYDNPEPVGNGPFEWDYWEDGQISKITAFRNHFYNKDFKYQNYCINEEGKNLARQPNIDAIVYKIYKTAEAAVLALRNDDIDYIAWSVPPTFVQELTREPGIAIQQSPEPGFFYMAYNMRRQSFGYNETGHDVGKPLRQAIAHCIDKERIVQRTLLNFGIPGDGPVSPLSEWYNNSLPSYDFDPDKAISILENASYILDDPSAPPGPTNHWNNPDGSEIGSGPDGLIEILGPEMPYDPCAANKGLMIAQQLQDIGINAKSVAMDFGSILQFIGAAQYTTPDEHNVDMYILSWRIGSEPADYLHAFFHSSQADDGQNYPGYQNESFDKIIDLARQTDDPYVKLKAVKDAQASIAYDLPMDVLYHRTNIEAYRSDRFTGWVVGDTGSIFNWESIKNIRAPSPYKVKAQFVSPPSAVVSNSTSQITVFVKDHDGNPLSGAYVLLNASSGALEKEEGYTTSSGKFTTTFTAPYVDPNNPDTANGTQVIIQIKEARYWGHDGLEYDPAPSRLTVITVYPGPVPFLCVRMSADPDIIDPDVDGNGQPGFTYIVVEVTDKNGDPVEGATVSVSVSPAIPTISPSQNTTNADGRARFTVTAADEPNDDGSTVEYLVTAYAEYSIGPNIRPGDNSMTVSIVDKSPDPPPPSFNTPSNFNLALAMGIFTGIVIVIALAVYIFYRKFGR